MSDSTPARFDLTAFTIRRVNKGSQLDVADFGRLFVAVQSGASIDFFAVVFARYARAPVCHRSYADFRCCRIRR